MQSVDVSVIGAGPAGSRLSSILAGEGLNVALIDKMPQVGKRACSGLVSKRVKKFVNLGGGFVEHEVRGAIFHSPNNSFEISKKSVQAYVLDRPQFDRHMFSIARDCGAKAHLGCPVESAKITDGGVACTAGETKISSELVVCADGAGSLMRQALGLSGNVRMVNGIIAYFNEKNYSPLVELFYGKSVAPGFFAWKIPRGARTEYGLAANKNHIDYFRKFLSQQGLALGRFYAHPIIFGEQKSCASRAILLGDAAAQVKPFSGGGIIYGLICAEIAARAIKKAFDRGDFSLEFFEKEYEARWQERILPKIRAGLGLRKTLDSLEDSELDALFSAVSEEKHTLQKFGDMDFL